MNTNTERKDLSSLLFGKTRRAILSLLFGHPDESYYLRQIARRIGFGLGPVQRELKQLTEAGIIQRRESGHQVYFQANQASPVFQELKSLITKTVGIGDTLRIAEEHYFIRDVLIGEKIFVVGDGHDLKRLAKEAGGQKPGLLLDKEVARERDGG